MSNPLKQSRDELRELIKKHWFCQHSVNDRSLWLERHVLDRSAGEDSYALQVRADRLRAEIKRLRRVQGIRKRTSIHAHQP
jgi:hypothetical protein